MLHELAVRNLGVIEEASVLLAPGLTALTGETGAGKTLVTTAISLLLGGRADPSLVRPGADEAVVEGRFVDAAGDEVVVKRVVPASGRSRSYVNSDLATLGAIAEATAGIVELHGQHGQQSLLKPSARRLALDEFGGHDTASLAQARAALRQAKADLDELGGDEFARARELELLQFQVEEIQAVGVASADEDDELAALESILGDATGHSQAADRAIELLSTDGPVDEALVKALASLADRVPLAAATERLLAIQSDVADVVAELRATGDGIENDPERLHEIQKRREALTSLRRKYGPDLAAVLAFELQANERLETIKSHAERAEALTATIENLQIAEQQAAAKLGADRRATAPKLAKRVEKELQKLALPKARLEVAIGDDPGDDVEFLVSMNPGSPLLPMAKVASGGELSRIMLALQLVVGSTASTVIYDEVDAGVGGEAATSIGQALAGVGASHQVLVVTHLPQVAACAAQQVQIVKAIAGRTTTTELRVLEHDDRIVELARMLSGTPDSENARAHAAELLDAAR